MFVSRFCLATVAISVANAHLTERGFQPLRIIEKDVIILGGGASGTYAAVRLREDFSTSIAIVERQDHLGGHVQTYTIPETNTTIEYGVQTYLRYGGSEAFFDRFNVEKQPFTTRRLNGINVDILTGKILTGYTGPSNNATTEAFKTWLSFVTKYESFLEPGYWNFPLPSDIPAELLLPFGQIAVKYGIEAAVPRIMAISNVGVGGIKDILTLYVVQAYGPTITRGVLDSSLFVPVGSNSLLYQRAYDLLKDDTYLSATILETSRTSSGVQLLISTGNDRYAIKAKKLLVTAPPSLDQGLQVLEFDHKERAVFKTWTNTWSFVGIVRIGCLADGSQVNFLSPKAVPQDHLAIRDYKYTLRFDSTGPVGLNLFRLLFATDFAISHEEAKHTIIENVQRLVAAGTVNTTGECDIEFKAFADHNSVLWRQSKKQLKDGFVQKLYGLQGYRGTWWTGGLWSADYSSNVWAYTDTVIPRLLKSL